MTSRQYLNWRATLDLKTCLPCRRLHGKIYEVGERIEPRPPLHEHCRCTIEYLEALLAGKATRNGTNGADWWLKYWGRLPDYYIAYGDAERMGWKPILGNLHEVLPGRMITGGRYFNNNRHLPSAPGRVWYEADINYTRGRRGLDRVLFSSDGLIFVTYDHYETFYEIV